MRSLAAIISAALLALTLQGCGGGGGGGGGPSPAPTSPVEVAGDIRFGVDVGTGSYVGEERNFTSLQARLMPSGETAAELSSYIAFDAAGLFRDFTRKWGVELAGDAQLGAFSGSVDFQRRREEITSFPSELTVRGQVFATVVQRVAELSAAAALEADGTLAEDLKALPTSYAGNGVGFAAFFAAHGTHRLSELKLGGKLRLLFVARMSRDNASDEVINRFTLGAKGHFQQFLGLPAEMSVSASDVDRQTFESFATYSDASLDVLGGESSKVPSWEDWRGTVANQLAVVDHSYTVWDDVLQELGRSENWTAEVVSNRTAALRAGLAGYLQSCPKSCSGSGRCSFAARTCSCDQNFLGDACDGKRCPRACGNGTCDTTVGQCACEAGWKHTDPADNTSACARDCRTLRFMGGHPCKSCGGCYHTHNRRALETPFHPNDHSDDRYYACMPLGANSVNDDPSVAGDLYCAKMEERGLVGAGARMTASEHESPLCSWDIFHARWCRGFRAGNDQVVDIGCPGCTHPSEPDYEQIFKTITCAPRCAEESVPVTDVPSPSSHGQRLCEGFNQTAMQIV